MSQLHEVVEQEPLTTDHIKVLFDHDPNYSIPDNQTTSKMYGIILVDSEVRAADGDACRLEEALQNLGCTMVLSPKLTELKELKNLIESSLETVAGGCSLMIICLLSCGIRQRELNAVVRDLQPSTSTLPSHVPLVSLLLKILFYIW